MKNSRPYILISTILIIFVITCLFAIWIINGNREIYTKAEKKTDSILTVVCSSENAESSFDMSNTQKNNHKINITFRNGYIDTLMYNLTLSYADENSARINETRLHVQDDDYMYNHNLRSDTISNTFSSFNNQVFITLYTTTNNLDLNTLELFQLSKGNLQDSKNELSPIIDNYTSKGFNCSEAY